MYTHFSTKILSYQNTLLTLFNKNSGISEYTSHTLQQKYCHIRIHFSYFSTKILSYQNTLLTLFNKNFGISEILTFKILTNVTCNINAVVNFEQPDTRPFISVRTKREKLLCEKRLHCKSFQSFSYFFSKKYQCILL